MSDKIKITIEMEVTEPQALALRAMFEHWTFLGNIGSSRKIGFFVDGGGDFRPTCKISFAGNVRPLTDSVRRIAGQKKESSYGDRTFDYDEIAGLIREGIIDEHGEYHGIVDYKELEL